jgi:predicted RNA binding protein YcfA (HicA-like mRNA interferase family)
MKLPVVSGNDVIKALIKGGFVVVRQKGSHVRLEKISNGNIINITVPLHNPLKKGTFIKIMKDARITRNEFIDLL